MSLQPTQPDKKRHDDEAQASKSVPPQPQCTTKPEEVFYLGVCYRLSAQCLLEQVGKLYPPETISGMMSQLFPTAVPGLILECLSIELFLKCLLQLESGAPSASRGHRLAEMFGKVSLERRERMKQIYDSLLIEWKAEMAGQRIIDDDPYTWELDRILPTLDDAFIKWRYAYEYGMGTTAFNTRVSISLQRAILEIRPEWVALTQFRMQPHR